MFKLKKILNKHNNAPELETLDMSDSTYGAIEYIYTLCDGQLTSQDETVEDKIYYVSYRIIDEYEHENRRAECYRITPEMIFEVTCPSSVTVGQLFKLAKSDYLYGYDRITVNGITREESDGYIVDVSNYDSKKKVLVRFHCKQ